MNCKFCGKLLKPNGSSHQSFCHKNPDRKDRGGNKNPMHGKKGRNQYINGSIMTQETKRNISKGLNGKQVPQKTRELISESMKRAHSERRAWNIGKSRWNSQESYPEIFFKSVIENEFIDKRYIREYPVEIYSIDFAWVDQKKAIEIDGEQHDRFQDYKERDSRKDECLKKHGWEILRLKWKDIYADTKGSIVKAYDFIHNPR